LFISGQTRIHFDEVEGLGRFVELEVVLAAGQPEEEGRRIAESLMKELGISKSDLIDCAYVDMLSGKQV
jgi:adenylate cyclase class IV